MLRRFFVFLSTCVSVLTLASIALAAPAMGENPGNLPLVGRPIDVSLDGHRGDFLFDVTAVSVVVLFVLQALITIVAVMKFRASKGAKVHYDHGTKRSDVRTIAILSSTIFVVVDVTLLYFSFRDINGTMWKWPTSKDTLQIEVVAQQWAWNVRYPGPDGKFNTADDIVTVNDLRIPINRPVHVRMKSLDVIHSFYLPNFRTKADAVPGATTQIWFQATDKATKPGGAVWEIGCAQHCGANHYKMHGDLTVYTPAEFEAWHKAAAEDAVRKFDATDVAAHWGWEWEK